MKYLKSSGPKYSGPNNVKPSVKGRTNFSSLFTSI